MKPRDECMELHHDLINSEDGSVSRKTDLYKTNIQDLKDIYIYIYILNL